MKAIYFNNVYPVCHAFDQDAKEGHDLVIGLSTGDGIFLHLELTFMLFENF